MKILCKIISVMLSIGLTAVPTICADTLVSTVEGLKVRAFPHTDSTTTAFLSILQRVILTGEISPSRTIAEINGFSFNEPFVEIHSFDTTGGWVFAGGLAWPHVEKKQLPFEILFSSYEYDPDTAKALVTGKHKWCSKKWYAFVKDKQQNSFSLKPFDPDFISDFKSINHYGEVIVKTKNLEAQFLIDGPPDIDSATFRTVGDIGSINKITAGENKSIEFIGKSYTLSGVFIDAGLVEKELSGKGVALIARIKSKTGRYQSTILATSANLSSSYTDTVEVYWAGDVNGDKLLDIAVASNKGCWGILEFYLSQVEGKSPWELAAMAVTWAMDD